MLALHSSNYIKGLLTLCEMKNKPISSAIPDCLGWYLQHLQSWEKEQGFLTYPLVISPLLFPVQTKVAGLMSPQNGGKWNFHQQYFQQVGRDKAGALRDQEIHGPLSYFKAPGILKRGEISKQNHKNCDFFKTLHLINWYNLAPKALSYSQDNYRTFKIY